jgi:two-component system sensor histidine kinase/response regulator
MSERQTILIVDDRPQNLLALEKTLSGTEAELVRATSGNAALTATLNHEFALAILDVQMPGMDGYELARLLREDPKTQSLPIIFLTAAYREDEQVIEGYRSGAVDYIVKPYNPDILLSKVNVFLQMDRQKAELQRQREQLESLNRELEAFTHSVSHDLRAPLRAVIGFSRILLEDHAPRLVEEGRECAGRIVAAAQRMELLIEDLLRLSHITKAEMRGELIDLSGTAEKIAESLHRTEPDRFVEFAITPKLSAYGDPALLQVALENLLGNAWKYTANHKRARIELGQTANANLDDPDPRLAGDVPVYYVRDDGAGFDMAFAGKLFAPFQRLHNSDEFPGTGIGLATVQRIINRHGGRIWARGEQEKGATFYFYLPLNSEQRGNLDG